jgi:ATP-dependent RNA helicase RhlE
VSLVCIDEKSLLHDIERFIKREISVEVIAGFEPDPNAKPQPIQLRSHEHRTQSRTGRGGNSSAGRQGKPARKSTQAAGSGNSAGNNPRTPKPSGAKPATTGSYTAQANKPNRPQQKPVQGNTQTRRTMRGK